MKTISYGEYSARMHRPHAGNRIPRNGSIELTHRCPLTCAHCYNNLPIGDRQAQDGELTLAQYRRILDELVEAGCVWLLFTGGEIFARPDFMDIYRHAKQRGFIITLFTNGTMLTPALVEELRQWPPFSIEITLYGHTAETYEALTGVPGSHARCLRGIQMLLAAGLPLKLKTVAVSHNKHEVIQMRAFA
jgi:MoaA/NifB/PqqE/SkfB family radical SAM enzyme